MSDLKGVRGAAAERGLAFTAHTSVPAHTRFITISLSRLLSQYSLTCRASLVNYFKS